MVLMRIIWIISFQRISNLRLLWFILCQIPQNGTSFIWHDSTPCSGLALGAISLIIYHFVWGHGRQLLVPALNHRLNDFVAFAMILLIFDLQNIRDGLVHQMLLFLDNSCWNMNFLWIDMSQLLLTCPLRTRLTPICASASLHDTGGSLEGRLQILIFKLEIWVWLCLAALPLFCL